MAAPDAGASFQEFVLDALQSAEWVALRALHAVGLAPDAHGQPGWPLARRFAVETLAIDAGLTRQVALTITCVAASLVLLGLGIVLRRRPRMRWAAWASAVTALFAAPWPSSAIVLTDAAPTSFHRSPTHFDAASIVQGLALYRANCAACHGADGHGDGPRAAGLAVWPPRVDGPLLQHRAEGEVFWRVLQGMHASDGAPTMPGFGGHLADDQVWAVIDAMKALAAGASVREDARWDAPVRAPDALVHCDDGQPDRRLDRLGGERVRLVAESASQPLPREDPRVVTVVLSRTGSGAGGGCRIVDARAWAAYAQVSGLAPDAFAGAQLLVDRAGWLRAFGAPGRTGWSQDDFICRSKPGPAASRRAVVASRDGLGDLITAIDDDPIRRTAAGAGADHGG